MNATLRNLLPPEDDPVKHWRLVVAASVIVLGLAVMAGFGAFEWIGFGGFARAADLEDRVTSVTKEMAEVKSDVKDLRLSQLEQAIYEAKRLKCVSNSVESERFYEGQLSKMHRLYFSLSGIALSVPDCDKVKP